MDILQEINKCSICARGCIVPENGTGKCGKYSRQQGELVETAPEEYLIICPISIETMPMVHFYPQGKFLQITTTGCNFSCPGCVSTMLVKEISSNSRALQHKTADEIVKEALDQDCIGITFVMNDPLASFFTFMGVAKQAKASGLLVGCSTNGYFTTISSNMLAPYLDFMNIGIKGFSTKDYQICGAHTIEPVLDAIAVFSGAGVHIETSITYKKGDEKSVEAFAAYLKSAGYSIPIQIMRYLPLEDALPDFEPSIEDSEKLCLKIREIQDSVYLFNTPGTDLLHTHCPQCGALLIERDFYGPMGAKVYNIHMESLSHCQNCGHTVSIKGVKQQTSYTEQHFLGGYPFTRALEMIQAMLVASGITDLSEVVKVWEKVLSEKTLGNLHEDLQSIDAYLQSITKFASYTNGDNRADQLRNYMQGKIDVIANALKNTTERPGVYYTMGKPLFSLKGSRFENQLVTAAGGTCLNKQIKDEGRPGCIISVETLNALDPDVIYISSFFSNSTDDYLRECLKMGVNGKAVRSKKIYTSPYPNWDFGSPRWILGLMDMANVLHPELFQFDIFKEAEIFYKMFYNTKFRPEFLNLSFARPDCKWNYTPSLVCASCY